MLCRDKRCSCTWKCPDSSFTPSKDISCFQAANLEANLWCAMSRGTTLPPLLCRDPLGCSAVPICWWVISEKRVSTVLHYGTAEERNRYGSPCSCSQHSHWPPVCFSVLSGLEQTWGNGSFLSWMVVNGLWQCHVNSYLQWWEETWCRVTHHQSLKPGLLC